MFSYLISSKCIVDTSSNWIKRFKTDFYDEMNFYFNIYCLVRKQTIAVVRNVFPGQSDHNLEASEAFHWFLLTLSLGILVNTITLPDFLLPIFSDQTLEW